MTVPVVVTESADPRLADYTALTDVALRRRREPAEGLFMAEGEKVIRRALTAGYPMRSMLLTVDRAAAMRDVIDGSKAPVYVVSADLAERVTGYHVHRGALAAMRRTPLPTARELLARAAAGESTGGVAALESVDDHADNGTMVASGPSAGTGQRVAVFEDFVDHANLGAAFRNAAALGINAVFLTPRCADPLYRRAVKVSMGAVLQVPWTRLESWPGDAEVWREAGYVTAALCLSEKAIPLDEFAARNHHKLALVFGTEGHGLTQEALMVADEHVRIPMAAGVDSLNVAAASAVAFYATRARPA